MKSRYSQLLFIFLFINQLALSQSILNYFKGFEHDGQIQLQWQMIQGNTCNGISIFHATDFESFTQIGEIGGICGSNTDTVNYSFDHKNPARNQNNYYKLEFGGLGSSSILQISLIDYNKGIQIRPHPMNGNGRIFFEANDPPYKLQSYDSNGALLYTLNSINPLFDIGYEQTSDHIQIFIILNSGGTLLSKGSLLNFK